MTDICKVAQIIADNPVYVPLRTGTIITCGYDMDITFSGAQRLRELAKMYRDRGLGRRPYEYRSGAYHMTGNFKKFCRRYLREQRQRSH